jgi:hypothetical protein
MQSKISLEDSMRLHPNVGTISISFNKEIIRDVIPKETFRTIKAEKLHEYMPKLISNKKAVYKYLPNLLAVGDGISALTEREALDYRLTKLKTKDPNTFNTLYNNLSSKIEEYKKKQLELEKEVLDALSEFKEITNVAFVTNNYRRN